MNEKQDERVPGIAVEFPQQNLDNTIKALVEHASRHHFSLIQDGHGRLRTFAAEALKEVTDRPKREHNFFNLESMLDFARADADKDLAAVFYDLSQVVLVLDRKLVLDKSVFKIQDSRDLRRWLRGGGFNQKQLIEHLQTWGGQAETGTFSVDSALLALHGLNLSKTIVYQATHQDGRTVQLNYTLDGGDPKSAKIPREWSLSVPVHEGGPVMQIPVVLDLQMPDNEKASPTFTFSCPTIENLKDKSLELIRDTITRALPGFLVLNGTV